jgi:hypothetical protein
LFKRRFKCILKRKSKVLWQDEEALLILGIYQFEYICHPFVSFVLSF